MSRTNIIFIAIVVIAVVLVGGTMAMLSDPENYKGQISGTFEDQTQMELEIRGDMNWRYWPPIALAVEDVVITPNGSAEPLATIASASFDMRLLPLLLGSGSIPVNGISIDGFSVNALIDAEGNPNWGTRPDEASTEETAERAPAGSAPTTQPEAGGESALGLDIRSIRITNTTINFSDDSVGAKYRISIPELATGSLKTNEPTEVRFSSTFEDLVAEMTARTAGNGQVTVSEGVRSITFTNFAIDETVTMPGFNPIVIAVSVNGTFDTDAGKADFDISGTLDASKISGRVGAELATGTSVSADLTLDQVTLDDYLGAAPAPAAGEVTSSGDAGAAPAPPAEDFEALPLELLRTMNVDARAQIGTLTYDVYSFSDFNIVATIKDSKLDAELNMQGYDGTISLKFNGSAETEGAGHTHMNVSGIDVAKVVETDWITGTVALESNTTFTGSMFSAILDSLDGTTTFEIVDGTLDIAPIKNLIVLADSLRGQDSGAGDWPDKMPFRNLAGQHRFNDGTRENQQFDFALEFMKVNGTGGLNYFNNYLAYDMQVQLKEDPDSDYRVPPGLARIVWPVTCKGSLDQDPVDLCLPSEDAAKDIAEDILKQEAEGQLRKKIEEKVPEGVKGVLKGLFRRDG